MNKIEITVTIKRENHPPITLTYEEAKQMWEQLNYLFGVRNDPSPYWFPPHEFPDGIIMACDNVSNVSEFAPSNMTPEERDRILYG